NFKKFNSINYEKHSNKDVFGFVKLYLLKKLDCLVDKSLLETLIGPEYKKTDIPRIIQSIYRKNSAYSIQIIQLLFCLMIYAHQSHHINNISEICLVNTFIPMFFGDSTVAKLKKKSPDKYFTLVKRWSEIIKYLPKGTVG
ncbi:hypothetical protein NEMIN01_1611, partial [Nematocida minor]|uniref:uncharacterized protein n=1 Tax=Nematocida minor TaxID=1912983 RepID=UPI00221E7873